MRLMISRKFMGLNFMPLKISNKKKIRRLIKNENMDVRHEAITIKCFGNFMVLIIPFLIMKQFMLVVVASAKKFHRIIPSKRNNW